MKLNRKKNNLNIFIVLAFSLLLISNSYSLNLLKLQLKNIIERKTFSKFFSERVAKQNDNPDMGANVVKNGKIVSTCLQAFIDVLPSSFCWKKGGDIGKFFIPCPSGYFRYFHSCFKKCDADEVFFRGLCITKCPKGYKQLPFFCINSKLDRKTRSARPSHFYLNSDKQVHCPGNMYKIGLLCFRDCSTISMYNCGNLACSSSKTGCAKEILKMTLKTLEGIATFVLLIVTFGASSGATTGKNIAVKSAKNGGKHAINLGKQTLNFAFNSQFRSAILKRAKNQLKVTMKTKLKDFAKESISDAVQTKIISEICSKVWENIIDKTDPNPITEKETTPFYESAFKAIDILGIHDIYKGCSDVSDGGLNCGKSITDTLSNFDPTGLLTIAVAFMHPTCDVPESAPSLEEDPLENENLSTEEVEKIIEEKKIQEEEHVKKLEEEKKEDSKEILLAQKQEKMSKNLLPNCMLLFNEIDFEGKKYRICNKNTEEVSSVLSDVKSFIIGKNTSGIFFEKSNFGGDHLPFFPGFAVKDITEIKKECEFKGLVDSIYVGNGVLITFSFGEMKYNYILDNQDDKTITYEKIKGSFEENKDKEFTQENGATSLSFSMYFSKKKIEVKYADNKTVEINDSFTIMVQDMPVTDNKTLNQIKIIEEK